MNTMPHEEQDFQDFLSGRDDLSKQLKSLPQPSPSAALDAAIFASISNELAKELEKKSAAAKKTKPALAQLINFLQDHLRSLWYLPVGAAALLLIGLNLREPSQPVEIAMQTAPPVAATAAIPPEFEVDSVLSETTVVAAPKAKAAKARIPRNHIASNETAASKEILVQAAVVAPTLQRVEVSGSRISSLPVTSSSAMNSIAPAPEAKVFAEEKTNTVAELSSTKADKPEELAQLRAITAVEDRQTDTAKVAAPTSVSEG